MKPIAPLFLLVSTSLAALDWGGSLETSLGQRSASDSTILSSSAARLWTAANWGDLGFQLKANLSNDYSQGLGSGAYTTNTFRGDLDTLVVETPWLRLGRSDFRDFSGAVLNTKLDGVQLKGSLAKLDMRAFAGISSYIFKGASTVIISEDDIADRAVLEDWSKPQTLLASPRAIAGTELSARQWVTDQTFVLSLLGQYDLRANEGVDGGRAYTTDSVRRGAPVSTAYAGLGWNGRVIGPLYGSLWAYGMAGTSLTRVGNPQTETLDDAARTQLEYKTWSKTLLLGGTGAFDLTLLAPAFQYLLLNMGVQVASGDVDGAKPSDNAEDPRTRQPTDFTGWIGISQSGGAILFNPQPANLASIHLIASIRPWESLQLASSTFVSTRVIDAPISETLSQGTKAVYLGTESDLSILWRPASDVGTSLSAGAFLPNPDAFDRKFEFKIQASVNLSF